MILDLIVLVIFSLTIFFSMRKGFAMTVVSFLRGIASVIAAWLFCDDLALFFLQKTAIGAAAASKIHETLSAKWTSSKTYELLPDLLRDTADDTASALIDGSTDKLTMLLLTILCFFLILIGLRLLFSLLLHTFSKEHRGGFVGGMDWFLGILMGILLGAVSVLLFLALLFPAAELFFPAHADTIAGWMEGSYFAEDLYNNNLLLILLRDFAVKG